MLCIIIDLENNNHDAGQSNAWHLVDVVSLYTVVFSTICAALLCFSPIYYFNDSFHAAQLPAFR